MSDYTPDPIAANELGAAVGKQLGIIFGDAARDAGDKYGDEGLSFDYVDPAAQDYAAERGAELIGRGKDPFFGITETERVRANDLLRDALDEGWSPQEFANRLEESGIFGEDRALMIARTEVAIAQNRGHAATFRELGIERVLVSDGDEDEECAVANGDEWTIEEAEAEPIAHPNAIMEGTAVLALGAVERAYRARWHGPLVSLRTARNRNVAIGPNHPILTGRGWIPAKAVREGDYVVSRDFTNGISAKFNLKNADPLIEDVFQALRVNASTSRCAAATTHFHGDGNFCQGEVEVVRPKSLLATVGESTLVQERREPVFAMAHAKAEAFARDGALAFGGQAVALAPSRGMRGSDMRGVEVGRPNLDPAFAKPVAEDAVVDTDFVRELHRGFALDVALDEVVEVGNVDSFVGHAFDLQTAEHCYFANGILSHNCTRDFTPILNEQAGDEDTEEAA